MAVAGRDANDDRQAWEHYVETWRSLMETCNGIIRAKHPGASTYYNGTTQFWTRDFTAHVSQIELEDLPSVGGSYDKFPLAAKHYATRGKALIAMSGKFHTAWGEFGGFKDADALRFETASMVAYGAASSMGDQMHPSGEMDMTTYRLLGKAYRYMESIEDLGMGAEHCANLGFWTSYSMPDDQGTASMLLECQVDFEEASRETEDLGRFRTIVIPGGPCLTEADASRLSAFVAAGGSLLVLGEGALDAGRTRFLLDVGAEYVGPGAYEMDYTLAGPAVAAGLPTSPFVNYAPAPRTRPRDGEVLAAVKEPYFDRTYGHYCSHQNTPCRDEPAAHPAALRKGRVVTLLNSVGRMYGEMGARVHRDWFMAALRLVYADPVQETRLPSAGRANLLHQADRRRYVTHLLYAPPLKRGKCLVIEDMPPILDVPVTLRVPERIRSARLEPQGKSLRMRRAGGAVSVVVPRVQCHQAVAWEY
jgi:hypothetical protein